MYQNIGRWSFLFRPYDDQHQSNLIACMWENTCYVNLGNYILSRMTFRRYLAHSAMKLLSQSDGTFLNQGMCFLTQRRSKEFKTLFVCLSVRRTLTLYILFCRCPTSYIESIGIIRN